MRCFLIAFGVLLALAAPPRQAPSPPAAPSVEFVRLFNQYRTADADAAVAEFASWDRARVERESAIDLPADDLRAQAALAAFHTEAGIRNGSYHEWIPGPTANANSDFVEPHAQIAERIVQAFVSPAATKNEELTTFCRVWLLATRAIRIRWGRGMTREALCGLEADPEVIFQLGGFVEKEMGPEIGGDGTGGVLYYPGDGLDRSLELKSFAHGNMNPERARQAENMLHQAIAVRPDLIEARLHLGRLYYMVDRFPDAERELKATYTAAFSAHDVFVGYLAALFLGQLQQDRRRPDEARASYEAAIEINPSGQVARLALGQLLLSLGELDEGWHAMRAGVSPPGQDTIDPWTMYPDPEFRRVPALLREMRASVRK